MLEVHINLLKRIAKPFVLGTQPPLHEILPQSDRVPWLNTEVIILTRGHQDRTRRAIVVDILCNQKTSSGLRVSVQPTSVNPSMPLQQMTLDYDDVVEARQVILNLLIQLLLTFFLFTKGVLKSYMTMHL